MSDNIAVTPGSGATVAADDISGVLHQRIKVSLGADGSATDALGGAGAVAGGVQRVTLASDDPGVVSLAAILAKIIAAPATETSVAAAATSLAIMDDWDESDRAKVNPIVGQAGIAAGAGAVGATVPRVTHASDDPAVTSLATLAGSLPMTNTQFLANLRSTATHSSVNSGTSSVTILASNANRKGARIFNTDANALYLDLSGGTAVAASRAQAMLLQNEGYDVPSGITGAITGIWAADGSGNASVVEAA